LAVPLVNGTAEFL